MFDSCMGLDNNQAQVGTQYVRPARAVDDDPSRGDLQFEGERAGADDRASLPR